MAESRQVATQDGKPKTVAEARKQKLDAFMGFIEQRTTQIETLLQDADVDPRLFLETCRRALIRDPDLTNTDPATFVIAALNCAADGLIPDGRKAALVKFGSTTVFIPMFQGLLEVAYKSGNFQSIEAQVVFKGDLFEYELGDNGFIRHTRSLDADEKEIQGAYAIAKTVNGGVYREVMGKRALDRVMNVSKAKSGPIKDWRDQMCRKAVLRRLWKYLPRTPAMDRLEDHDNDTYVPAPHEREPMKLHGEFSQPALTDARGATEVVGKADTTEHEPVPVETIDEALDGDDIPQEFTEDARVNATAGEHTIHVGDGSGTFPEPDLPPMKTGAQLKLEKEADEFEALLRKQNDENNLQAAWGNATPLRKKIKAEMPERYAVLDKLFDEIKERVTR